MYIYICVYIYIKIYIIYLCIYTSQGTSPIPGPPTRRANLLTAAGALLGGCLSWAADFGAVGAGRGKMLAAVLPLAVGGW